MIFTDLCNKYKCLSISQKPVFGLHIGKICSGLSAQFRLRIFRVQVLESVAYLKILGVIFFTFPSPSWPPASASLTLILLSLSFSPPCPDIAPAIPHRRSKSIHFLAHSLKNFDWMKRKSPRMFIKSLGAAAHISDQKVGLVRGRARRRSRLNDSTALSNSFPAPSSVSGGATTESPCETDQTHAPPTPTPSTPPPSPRSLAQVQSTCLRTTFLKWMIWIT